MVIFTSVSVNVEFKLKLKVKIGISLSMVEYRETPYAIPLWLIKKVATVNKVKTMHTNAKIRIKRGATVLR